MAIDAGADRAEPVGQPRAEDPHASTTTPYSEEHETDVVDPDLGP